MFMIIPVEEAPYKCFGFQIPQRLCRGCRFPAGQWEIPCMINGVSKPGRELKTAWRQGLYARGDGEAENHQGTGHYTDPEESGGRDLPAKCSLFAINTRFRRNTPPPRQGGSGKVWMRMLATFPRATGIRTIYPYRGRATLIVNLSPTHDVGLLCRVIGPRSEGITNMHRLPPPSLAQEDAYSQPSPSPPSRNPRSALLLGRKRPQRPEGLPHFMLHKRPPHEDPGSSHFQDRKHEKLLDRAVI